MNIPDGKKITYVQLCCNIWLQKRNLNQTRLMVDGDRLEHERQVQKQLDLRQSKYTSTVQCQQRMQNIQC